MKTFILLTAILAIGASYALNLDKAQPPESRIVNGDEASTTDMPYHVALFVFLLNSTTQGNRCGGALISETAVLTAAHCFGSDKKLAGFAYLGSNNFGKGTRVAFNRVTVHANYNPTSFVNDIAIVHLDKAVKPNGSTINIIELNKTFLAENTEVTVSGFGYIAENVNTNKLMYTKMTIRNKKVCKIFSGLVDSQVCAKGDNRKGTCKGDSGGPVVINWPNNPTHVGLVSFGANCVEDKPKIFTRTASFISWIENNMK